MVYRRSARRRSSRAHLVGGSYAVNQKDVPAYLVSSAAHLDGMPTSLEIRDILFNLQQHGPGLLEDRYCWLQ